MLEIRGIHVGYIRWNGEVCWLQTYRQHITALDVRRSKHCLEDVGNAHLLGGRAGPITGNNWPIMETGISKLAKDDAPALIHFEDGQTQQWLMVRLEEPENAGTE